MLDRVREDVTSKLEATEVYHSHSTYVIFGEHAVGDIPLDKTVWSSEVQSAIASINPRPSIIAADSVRPGYFSSYSNIYFPSEESNHFQTPGSVVRLLGADIPKITEDSGSSLAEHQTWDKVFSILSKIDPSFSHTTDQSAFADKELMKAYGVESVGAGLAAFSGSLLYKFLSEGAEKDGNKSLFNVPMTRRQFLKFGFAAVASVVVSGLRIPIFYNNVQTEVRQSAPSLLSMIADITKPVLYNAAANSMRNAKIGLAMLDYRRSYVRPGETSAIVLGSLHKIGEFPAQLRGESEEEAGDRMLGFLSESIHGVVQKIRSENQDIPLPIIATTLKKLFSEYSVFDFPQYPDSNTTNSEYSWSQGNDHVIAPIEQVIDLMLEQ